MINKVPNKLSGTSNNKMAIVAEDFVTWSSIPL
jgi:hypothetical protein